MEDIHRYAKRIETYLARVARSDLSETNKKLIEAFVLDCHAERLSLARIYRMISEIYTMTKLLGKELSDATTDDLKRLVRDIDFGPKEYAEPTKKEFRIVLKKFYKWLNHGELPENVAWIKTTIKLHQKRLPEEFLTATEVRDMVNAASNPRDKAFVFILYESGCRMGELMNMKLKNVSFDQYGATIMVHGKTGPRRIRIILACDYLRTWLENHPNRGDPESFVWVNMSTNNRGFLLSYPNACKALRQIATRAGIKKRVNPHGFRHARATELAGKLTESQLCEVFGWTLSSRMPATYVHLSGRNVDDALLRVYGLKEKTGDERRHCPRCKEVNDSNSQYCRKCGLPFGLDVAMKAEQERGKYDGLMSRLIEDEGVQTALKNAMRKLDAMQ